MGKVSFFSQRNENLFFLTFFCKENCWTCFNLKGIVWDQWTGSFTLLEYLSDRFVLIHLFQIWWSPNLWHPLEYFNSEAGYFRSITHIAGIVDIWNYCANGVVFVCLYLCLCLKRSNQANGVVFVRHIFSSALDFWWSTTLLWSKSSYFFHLLLNSMSWNCFSNKHFWKVAFR